MSYDDNQLVVFSMKISDSTCEYGIPINQVQEINRLDEVTKLPEADNFIEGIINLRGNVIPLIDIKKRFALGETERSDETRIIVFNINGQLSGIIVDDVQEVLHVKKEDIDSTTIFLSQINSRYIEGVAKIGKRLIIILDLTKILSHDEQEALTELGTL